MSMRKEGVNGEAAMVFRTSLQPVERMAVASAYASFKAASPGALFILYSLFFLSFLLTIV